MNNVLELKGKRFVQAAKSVSGGGPAMNSHIIVTSQLLQKLAAKLSQIYDFWVHERRPFQGTLISVFYNKIVAKSNRISGLFRGDKSNYSVVGAKFNKDKTKHIITYYLSLDDLINSVTLLYQVDNVVNAFFENGVSKVIFENTNLLNRMILLYIKLQNSRNKNVFI